jgi:hypothetical protein
MNRKIISLIASAAVCHTLVGRCADGSAEPTQPEPIPVPIQMPAEGAPSQSAVEPDMPVAPPAILPDTNAVETVELVPWFANAFTNDPEILDLVKQRDETRQQLKQAKKELAQAELKSKQQMELASNEMAQLNIGTDTNGPAALQFFSADTNLIASLEFQSETQTKVDSLKQQADDQNNQIKQKIIDLLEANLNQSGTGEQSWQHAASAQAVQSDDVDGSAATAIPQPEPSSGSAFDTGGAAPSPPALKGAAPIPIPIDVINNSPNR